MIEMIKAATKNCKREDCELIVTGTTQTLVAHVPTFTKEGFVKPHIDPNTYSSRIECKTCGKKWDAAQRQDQLTVNAVSAE